MILTKLIWTLPFKKYSNIFYHN